jgi:glycosyltransferase involved in cell wall biosynthesis
MPARDKPLPLVSIITVCYNSAFTIERTIQSVIGQSYKDIEYIVIDGGSTDGTVEIIKRYASAISYWASEKDSGIYDAMNKGIRASHGELVGIINSDDWYEPDTVARVVEANADNAEVGIFDGIFRVYKGDAPQYLKGNYFEYLENDMPPHSTCFVRKRVYDEVGLFDQAYRSAADYDFLLKCKKRNVIFLCIPFVLANFQLGGVSSTLRGLTESVRIDRKYGYISFPKMIAVLALYHLRDIGRKIRNSHAESK